MFIKLMSYNKRGCEAMEISKEQLEHVAKLAKLNLTEEEKRRFPKDLGNMIEFVNKLNSVDTEGVQPTAHVIPINNVFREDEDRPSFDRELILKNAPSKKDGCISVPKVVE